MTADLLISGVTGFVGQHLASYLTVRNYSLLSVGRKTTPEIHNYQSVYDQHVDATYWIHLAGKAHDVSGKVDEEAYEKANFELTKRMFDAFLASATAKVFVFMSSVKAAADQVDGILDESTPAHPQTAYGKSKRKAEEYLLAQPLGDKRLYILRPCMIHGPGNKGNLNLLYKFVKTGLPYPLAAFENKRSFLSIENLCFLVHQLLESRAPSGIYQLADDEAISTNTLLQLIGESLGKKARLWRLPKYGLKALARIGDWLVLPLNSDRLKKLTESYVVNNQKIKATLGVELPMSAKAGLAFTLKHFKNA